MNSAFRVEVGSSFHWRGTERLKGMECNFFFLFVFFLLFFTDPVILNPNTASTDISVSDDLTSVTSCLRWQDEPNPFPLHSNRIVLGSVGYGIGTHTWEIEVGNSRHWSLGVCFGLEGKPITEPLTPANGFWGLRRDGDSYETMTTGISRLNTNVNPEVVRVKLEDYADDTLEKKRWRKVRFFDARSDSLIAGFSEVPLEKKLFPFVIPEHQTVPLRVVPANIILTVEQKLSFRERHDVLIRVCIGFVMVIFIILAWKNDSQHK